jgi:hypothetical protein
MSYQADRIIDTLQDANYNFAEFSSEETGQGFHLLKFYGTKLKENQPFECGRGIFKPNYCKGSYDIDSADSIYLPKIFFCDDCLQLIKDNPDKYKLEWSLHSNAIGSPVALIKRID